MTSSLHAASKGRLLAVIARNEVKDVLMKHKERPVVALLTCHDFEHDPIELEPAILSLLEAGCEYFVCFGAASEALHDRIDELIVDRTQPTDKAIITTWHDDEMAADVAAFFFNVAATKD